MKYRKLGKTNLRVSVIGIGTDQFYGEWGKQFSQSEVKKILDKAKSCGINFIDTAECYGNHLSESLIGDAIRENRKDWIIATKFGHKYHSSTSKEIRFEPESVLQQLDESLEALKTDYIDIYQFHSGSNKDFDQDELWAGLEKKVHEGKINHLGISLVNSAVLTNDLHQIRSASRVKAEAVQVVYNRINKKAEEMVLPLCLEQQIGVIGRVPLAKGHLSGKYKPGHSFPSNDRRFGEDQEQTSRQLKLVQDIREKELPLGMDMAQWALAWCLQHPAISTIIPGCKSLEQVEMNAKAADLDMVKESHPLHC